MDTEMRIREAMENGEVLWVKYWGGSQPGSVREISPITLSGDKVRVRCLTSESVKTFNIHKIEVLPGMPEAGASGYDIDAPKSIFENVTSMMDIFELVKNELETAGWIVQVTPDRLSIHGRFNNGKPRKTPKLSLEYHEFVLPYNEFGEIDRSLEPKRSARPWVVKRSTFKNADKAAERFMDVARTLVPA
jgi:hypothetical protein